MRELARDLHHAMRAALRRPGVTAVAVVALTLGIGLTATMFSIVNGVMLTGLPFEESERLLHIERTRLSEGDDSLEVTLHDYLDWVEQQTSFEELAAWYDGTVNIAVAGSRPERLKGAFVTPSLFRVLRVQPPLGRAFDESEGLPGTPEVVLLSHATWRDHFRSDSAAIGSTLRVNGETATVIGVMGEGFRFPIDQEIWLPLRLDPLAVKRGEGTSLDVLGRLAEGSTRDEAEAELAAIAARLEQAYPETNAGVGTIMRPYIEEVIDDPGRPLLWTMLGAVFGVLLVACANVANLMLARSAARSGELAIRSALGAGRWRLVAHLLAESAVLASVAAALGLVLAWYGTRAFNEALAVTATPFWFDVGLNPRVFGFVVAIAGVTALAAGGLPALRASRQDVNQLLKDESRGSSGLRIGRLSRALVVAEVAVSCALLVAAGLMVRSVVQLRNVDLGFDAGTVYTARVGLFAADYPDAETRTRFLEDLRRRLAQRPDVEAAAVATSLPALGSGRGSVVIDGHEPRSDWDLPHTNQVASTTGYFRTLGVALLEGRDFVETDRRTAEPVAIVNRSFVRRFLPGGSPLGKRVRVLGDDGKGPWRRIVGVAPDLHLGGLGMHDDRSDGVYIPLAQDDARFAGIAVRSTGPLALAAEAVREEVAALDPELPLYWTWSLREGIQRNTWYYDVFGTLFAVFGVAALLLASVGLYAVMAFSVEQRTTEIGIRIAIGAQAGDVVRMVLRQGAFQLGVGLVLGLVAGAGLARLIRALLFEVEPDDPAVYAAIVLTLVAAGVAASFLPAARAVRVEPVEALRQS